jgi:hypothetical protein
MKFKHTFDTEDGSVNATLFKTVMIQERNKYVKNVIDDLMKHQYTYLQARSILLNVYPEALDYCISSDALEPDNASVASIRSTGSSVWTVIGSTVSSLWRNDQAVMEQLRVDNTFLSRLASTGIWFLKTAAETLIYETQGVATIPGMAEEPPVFAERQTDEQRKAVRHAVHAVSVFDRWVSTVTSQAVFEMMRATDATLNHDHVVHCVDRVKQFCRLTSQIKPLNDGTLLYVVNPDTVTGLIDTLRTIHNEEGARVFNGCLSSILELQMMMVNESKRQELLRVNSSPDNQAMLQAGSDMVQEMGGHRQEAAIDDDDDVRERNIEMQIIALDASIPPSVVIESVVAGGGGGGGAAGGAGNQFNASQELGSQDPGMPVADEQGGGRSRSRKRSASKRTRRKAKQSSKKLNRKTRRYVRRRRSTRRKN